MTQLAAEFGLSIVIVTYNSASVLPGLLDSLPAGLEGIKQFETIVVNDSADDSADIAPWIQVASVELCE
jgi:N-acetylglucosaminyl-diphospho-decaprenol L-rhamnosyltransferase